jgi:hypothetical protein
MSRLRGTLIIVFAIIAASGMGTNLKYGGYISGVALGLIIGQVLGAWFPNGIIDHVVEAVKRRRAQR